MHNPLVDRKVFGEESILLFRWQKLLRGDFVNFSEIEKTTTEKAPKKIKVVTTVAPVTQGIFFARFP